MQGIGKKNRAQTLSLVLLRDGQATDQGSAHQRIARDVLAGCLRQVAMRHRHRAKGIVTQDIGRLLEFAQHEHGICLPADILAGLDLEITIQARHATGKAASIVSLVEKPDLKVVGWRCRHSPDNPVPVLPERALQPFVRGRRIDQYVEKDSALPFG